MYQNFIYPPTDDTSNHTSLHVITDLYSTFTQWLYTTLRRKSFSL